MAEFPKDNQPQTVTLANTIIGGLPSDPIFNGAPVSPTDLQAALNDFNARSAQAEQARAVAEAATQSKTNAFNALVALMKRVLKWAEDVPGITEAQLKKIGWGFAAPPTPLEKPGQCLNLVVRQLNGPQGIGHDLDWHKPTTGGKASGFRIYLRDLGAIPYGLLDAVQGRDHHDDKIYNLPPGKHEIAVSAVNDAGEGPLSNSVIVTV